MTPGLFDPARWTRIFYDWACTVDGAAWAQQCLGLSRRHPIVLRVLGIELGVSVYPARVPALEAISPQPILQPPEEKLNKTSNLC